MTQAPALYRERLSAPLSWWVIGAVLVATLVLAVGYPLGWLAGVVTAVIAGGAQVWVLVSAAAQVRVDEGTVTAGRATLPRTAVGRVSALDAAAAAALRGTGADARAYVLLRPWVPCAVRVDVVDPDDPTPYWYVASRHPAELAETLSSRVRDGGPGSAGSQARPAGAGRAPDQAGDGGNGADGER